MYSHAQSMLSDLGGQDASDVVRRRTFALPKFARFDQVVDPGRHLIVSSRIIFSTGHTMYVSVQLSPAIITEDNAQHTPP
jgi:hypothetical protein